ncbi:hypothetical protein I4U23_030879 [Adineta vaga]|nr:hypothetical protein I4U23_030879 [Adineta vaga]
MIELRDYCDHSFAKMSKKDRCQCFPANYTIQSIREWAKALVKPGKSHMNTVRANKIKASTSISLYFFVSFIFLFVLLGGIAGLIFYWIKLKAIPKKTLK